MFITKPYNKKQGDQNKKHILLLASDLLVSDSGDDGNRTRVRKPIHKTFFERSLSFAFPQSPADRHAELIGNL